MNKIKIGFPDGSIQEYDEGISALEIAKSISKKFSEAVLIAEYNGKPIDLDTKLTEDGNILFHKFDSDKGKSAYWHSTSHLMAQAIEELFPGVKFGVGPAIESGFYYDVDLDRKLTDDDLKAIEEKMAEISKRDLKPVREEMPREKAIEFFRTKRKDLYKVEILEDIAKDDKVVSVYHQGNFSDLCKGPHISSTSKIKSVKLLSVSGSYWRGDENRKMLQRVYGISFPTQKELDEYLKQLEEAKKRDHRKIGKELELFFFNEVSPGAPFWMPNGMVIFKELEKFWRYIHEESGYQEIGTPIVVRESLFRKSGHLEHYREHMYKVVTGDEDNFYLKPMNCPEATLIYSYKLRSYKDLPIRLSEIGRLHRYELSGALGGMFRVRQITMDDAHIFCREDQMLEEITGVLKLIKTFYAPFNFKTSYYLSTRPDKAMGEPELWIQAEASLEQALKKNELEYKVNAKDGAFYGPKIDIHIKDALNRTWQVATVQLDFQMPERLDLTYEGSDGKKHRPVMIHRAIFGSFERFLAFLIENYAGNFPLWIAPVQIAVLTITDAQDDYAKSVYNELKNSGFRVYLDLRNEKIGYKIREAENKKIPFMVIIGEKEMQMNNISVRLHQKGDIGKFELKQFIEKVNFNVNQKTDSINI